MNLRVSQTRASVLLQQCRFDIAHSVCSNTLKLHRVIFTPI